MSVRFRVECAYLGTPYSGWAKQPNKPSIQASVEVAIATVLHCSLADISTVVAGRTDAGVHALGQVFHVDVADHVILRPALVARLLKRVNGALRTDKIVVHSFEPAVEGFNARFSALSRRYEYRLADHQAKKNPLSAQHTATSPFVLDGEAMNTLGQALLGLHDFQAFCRPKEGATTIRNLLDYRWVRAGDNVLVATLVADAFCHSMVRSLVGAAVSVGRGKISVDDVLVARASGARTDWWVTMPAQGLTLIEVAYPDDGEVALRANETRRRRRAAD